MAPEMKKITLEDLAQLPRRIWELEVKIANRTDLLAEISGQHSDGFVLTEQFIIELAERVIGLEAMIDESYKELAEKFNTDLSEYASGVNTEMNKIQDSVDEFQIEIEQVAKTRTALNERAASNDKEDEGLGSIEITDAMMERFISQHMLYTDDDESTAYRREVRYAFRKWLNEHKGRYDRDLTNVQARELYDFMEGIMGPGIYETSEGKSYPDRFIGVELFIV